jgi:hypothetical protein
LAKVASVKKQPSGEDQALIDSGVADSITNKVRFFTSMLPVSMNLIVASTDRFPVRSIGDVLLPTPYGQLKVSNVLYCPNISGTIILVGKFKLLDGKVKWNDDTYTLVQDGKPFPTTERNNRCFLPFSYTESKNAAICVESDILHERIGHFSLRMLRETVRRQAVSNAPEVKSVKPNRSCETCAMMKATHLPVEFPSREVCLEPGDVIAADVIGPYDISLDRFKYVLTVQDLHSGMVSAIPIKTKGEATGEVIKWIRKFNNFSKWHVRRLRTDNALEFIKSKEMADFLGAEGILHKKSVPYKHHQNGAVERVNWTLAEMARSLLHSKRLQKYLWLFAFRQAAFIFNRLVHRSKEVTPIERVLGIKPSLEMLRVFGCDAYVYDHTHKKQMVPYHSLPLK